MHAALLMGFLLHMGGHMGGQDTLLIQVFVGPNACLGVLLDGGLDLNQASVSAFCCISTKFRDPMTGM
jgi:hypothetical protein